MKRHDKVGRARGASATRRRIRSLPTPSYLATDTDAWANDIGTRPLGATVSADPAPAITRSPARLDASRARGSLRSYRPSGKDTHALSAPLHAPRPDLAACARDPRLPPRGSSDRGAARG